MSDIIQHSTHLWISDPETLTTKIIAYLQKQLCKDQACQKCITCQQISTREHPWIIWITPERSYTLEQIDEVIAMSSFMLDTNEQRFFIFPQAERLTDQCSNRLLKIIEEPLPGYHFFFLAQRLQAISITIQSRCVIQKFTTTSHFDTYKDFLQPFLQIKFNDPINFIKQLDSLDIKEQESKELTDELFLYWSTVIKNKLLGQEQISVNLTKLINLLKKAINNPPMTGSTKIFWKNLYLAAHHATISTNSKS